MIQAAFFIGFCTAYELCAQYNARPPVIPVVGDYRIYREMCLDVKWARTIPYLLPVSNSKTHQHS